MDHPRRPLDRAAVAALRVALVALGLAACSPSPPNIMSPSGGAGGAGAGGSGSGSGSGGAGAGGGATVLAANQNNPMGVAVDGSFLYWANDADVGAVLKVPLGGGAPTQLAALANPVAVAVDATNVYVAVQGDRTLTGGSIVRVPIAGGPVTTIVDAVPLPNAIVVDDANVYWTDEPSELGVFVLPKGASGPSGPPVLVGCNQTFDNPSCNQSWMMQSGGAAYLSLTQDATQLYWADGGAVWSTTKGTLNAVPTAIVGNVNGTQGIALVGSVIYWTDGASVWASTIAGGTPRQMITDLDGTWGITADANDVWFGIQNGTVPMGVLPVTASGKGEADLVAFANAPSPSSPNGVTSDANWVYWASSVDVMGAVFKAHK